MRAQWGEPARRCLHQWTTVTARDKTAHCGAGAAGSASLRNLPLPARQSRLCQQNTYQVEGICVLFFPSIDFFIQTKLSMIKFVADHFETSINDSKSKDFIFTLFII